MPAEVIEIASVPAADQHDRLTELRGWWEADSAEDKELSGFLLDADEEDGSGTRAEASRARAAVDSNPEAGAFFALCQALSNVREPEAAFTALCACIAIATLSDRDTPTASSALFKYGNDEHCPPEICQYMLNWLTPVIFSIRVASRESEAWENWTRVANIVLCRLRDKIEGSGLSQASAAAMRLQMHELLSSLEHLLNSLPKQERTALEARLLSVFKAAGGVADHIPQSAMARVARETTDRPTAEPRPDWIEARKQGEALADFIARAFAQELASGEMHRGLLSRYEELQGDYYSLRRSKQFPEQLRSLPTRTEWIKRQVAEGKVNPVRPSSMQEGETRAYHRDMSRLSRARKRADVCM